MTQPVVCPACRKLNSSRARFCQHCGHDVILNNAGPRYFLTRVIKEGGQGAVYEGCDEAGKVYAVKEMLDNFSDPKERADAVVRFTAEAETLRRLSHPRIPRIYASFDDAGRHYLVMDFIRGEDLDDIVTREGPIPEARVLAWATELCDVLEYLHGRGVIYRDLKPSNMMLEQPGGTLKLIDFGIAKVFQPQTRGTQIGTPGYAPPEQYQGMATQRSDIYALGASLHHLLSGRDPRQHAPFNFPLLRTIVPAISARTEAAVARALEMREEDRFATIGELRTALLPIPTPAPRSAPAVSPQPPVSTPTVRITPPPPTPTPPPVMVAQPPTPVPVPVSPPAPPARRSRRGLLLVTLIILIVGLGGVGVFLLFGTTPPGPQPTAPSTPQTLVAQRLVLTLEVGVATGSDSGTVNQALVDAFLVLARQQCNCNPEIQAGTLIFDADPRQVRSEGGTTYYQATLEATILVPEQ